MNDPRDGEHATLEMIDRVLKTSFLYFARCGFTYNIEVAHGERDSQSTVEDNKYSTLLSRRIKMSVTCNKKACALWYKPNEYHTSIWHITLKGKST